MGSVDVCCCLVKSNYLSALETIMTLKDKPAVPPEVLEGIKCMASTYWLAHMGPNSIYNLVMKWVKEHESKSDN